MEKGEIILYQPNNSVNLEVRIEADSVWLTQAQMALLFGCSTDNVGLHLKNIYQEHEIEPFSTSEEISVVRKEGNRIVTRNVRHYNLDAILSVGYRISSANATKFRQWANKVLKEYLLRGYAVSERIEKLEQRVSRTEEKIDFFVRTSLPPIEGIFFNGQIFDAYVFATDLIKSANTRIILIDNYLDESVLLMLAKREASVSAKIITQNISNQLRLDLARHNSQYPVIEIEEKTGIHDRFLIIDDTLYHLGASLKDLGKKLFAFSKMELSPEMILNAI